MTANKEATAWTRFRSAMDERSRLWWNAFLWLLMAITLLFLGGYVGIVFIWLGQIYDHYPRLHEYIVVFIHVGTGAVVLLLGLLQFVPQIRQRWPKFHRYNGYLVMVAGLISGVGAFATCFWAFGGAPVALSAGVVSLYWLLTIVMGYRRIIQRDIQGHREWMIRFFSLAYSIVAMRLVIIIAMTKWSPSVAIGAGIPVTLIVFILGAEFYIAATKQRSHPPEMVIAGEMHITLESWQKLTLVSKSQLSHNTSLFVFELPHPSMKVHVPAGHHILLRVDIDGRKIIRPYSPVNLEERSGVLEFIIKKYKDGKMSTYLHDTLQVGDQIELKGPEGSFDYKANDHEHVVLMAGGTGITPIVGIVTAILRNPFDTTKITLFYANPTSSDIILLDELREMAQDGSRLKLVLVLSRPALADLDFERGRIEEALVRKNAPEPNKAVRVIICGPQAMCIAMMKLAGRMGYSNNSTYALGVSDH